MKTKLRTLGVIVFLSLSLNSEAQTIQIDKLYKIVINSMIATYKKPIEKKTILFSIWISVDSKGMADSVAFSKIMHPLQLEDFINPASISAYCKSQKEMFKNYKNSVIVVPIIHFPDNIATLYLYELGEDFGSLFPLPGQYPGKRLVVNKPSRVSWTEEEQ